LSPSQSFSIRKTCSALCSAQHWVFPPSYAIR
jgi:hypothetical protein